MDSFGFTQQSLNLESGHSNVFQEPWMTENDLLLGTNVMDIFGNFG